MAEITKLAMEKVLQRAVRSVGLELRRYRPEATEFGRLATMLEGHGVNLVLDVGANTGQFASSLRLAGYQGRIISFEPLAGAHAELLRHSRRDPQWDIAPRAAIGDQEDEVEMHMAGNSVSSSVLEMLDSHSSAAPGSNYIGRERVRLSTLDALATSYLGPSTVPFLKIDTQGYEDRVLDGAPKILAEASGLQLELSLVPLYEGQKLFDVMIERLCSHGFSIWSICPGFFDSRSGRLLQIDVTFFRD